MSSDEEYLFDETEDRDSGNESPEISENEDEGDWGMDIGLGVVHRTNRPAYGGHYCRSQ